MVHHPLLKKQLSQVVFLAFAGCCDRIIRIIRHAGRSGVAWVYFATKDGHRRATFLSVSTLNRAFLKFLTFCDKNKLNDRERRTLSRSMLKLLNTGDLVSKPGKINFGTVVEVGIDRIFVDWGDRLATPELPLTIEIF